MLARLRPVLEPATKAIGIALVRSGVTPNAITTVGLLATLGCCWILVDGNVKLAGWLLVPVLLLDLIDGAAARASGKVTAWGGFYDATCDRVGDSAVLASIAYVSRSDPRMLALVLVAIITSGLVPYTRAKAEAFGIKPPNGPGERPERSALLIAGLVFDILEPMLWVIIVLTALTAVLRAKAVRTHGRGIS